MTLPLARLARRWEDPAFWRALCPRLHVDEKGPIVPRRTYRLAGRQLAEQRALLKHDGYVDIQGVVDLALVDPMADGVRRLSRLGIPVVFALVYDEFWSVLLEVAPIVSGLLGRPFVVLPDVWTWCVDRRHPTNFSPHRDAPFTGFLGPGGTPTALTMWVPLTDVTTRDSCIYVVPRSLDPAFPAAHGRARRPPQAATFPVKALENVRALPARRGSLLGWNLGLLHWGSRPHGDAPHRISVGYFVQTTRIGPLNTPLVDLGRPLSLEARLGLIGKQIHQYSRDRRPPLMRAASALMAYLPSTPTTSGHPARACRNR